MYILHFVCTINVFVMKLCTEQNYASQCYSNSISNIVSQDIQYVTQIQTHDDVL